MPSGITTSRDFASSEICVTYPLEEARVSGFPFLDHSSGVTLLRRPSVALEFVFT